MALIRQRQGRDSDTTRKRDRVDRQIGTDKTDRAETVTLQERETGWTGRLALIGQSQGRDSDTDKTERQGGQKDWH